MLIMALIETGAVLLFISVVMNTTAKEKDFNLLVSERLYDAVESELSGPIKISRGMSDSIYIDHFLNDEEKMSEEECVEIMTEYLASVKKSADYDTAFLVSDSTMRYYTSDGLNKVVDPDKDTHDKWYTIFTGSDKPYLLDVDVDEANENRYTVFVNARITDDDGSLRGVCGVGVEMKRLQDVFKKYEQEYGIRISLVNSNGLVQADVNDINIESTFYGGRNLSADGGTTYTRKGLSGYEITRFIKDLNWYLVIESETSNNGFDRSVASVIIFCIVMFLLVAALSYVLLVRGIVSVIRDKNRAERDELTGLLNRNYFNNVYGVAESFNTTRYKTMIVLNVDDFEKKAGTQEGDDFLKYLTLKMQELAGDNGELFRWGEDEFVMFSEWSQPFSVGIFRQICREVEKDGKATVSVGITEIHMADTIKSNYHRAKQACYIVKETGGSGVKII